MKKVNDNGLTQYQINGINNSGKNNYQSRLYATPWKTSYNVSDLVTDKINVGAIRKYCNNPDKIINSASIKQSKYFNDSHVGMTYRDTGFFTS